MSPTPRCSIVPRKIAEKAITNPGRGGQMAESWRQTPLLPVHHGEALRPAPPPSNCQTQVRRSCHACPNEGSRSVTEDASHAAWLEQARSYLRNADPVLARLIDDRP